MGNKEQNIGISIGRLVLCFLVIMCHFSNTGGAIGYIKRLAVPAFTLISFYLTYYMFYNIDSNKIRQRICRLLYPYVFWAIVYYIGVSCLKKEILPIKELLWQLASGSNNILNPTLWFLLAQMIYVLVLSVVFFVAKDKRQAQIVLGILAFMCLLIHYTGLSVELFWGWRVELKWFTGYTLEVFPYAVLGIFYGEYETFGWNKNNKWFKWLIGIALFGIGIALPDESVVGFGYYGIKMLICGTGLSGFFIYWPFRLKKLAPLVNNAAKYSLGVYCIHLGMGRLFYMMFPKKCEKMGATIIFCLIVYLCSFFVSYLIGRLPFGLVKKIVN